MTAARFDPIHYAEGSGLSLAKPTILPIINAADWDGQPVPEREWIVENWIPAKTVTLLTGEGGTGKSILALQLAVARALRRPWIGLDVRPGRTLYLSAEDDIDELHRRINSIRRYYNASFADLADFRLVDLVGRDAVLGSLRAGAIIEATPLFNKVMEEITEFHPDLVVVDALADAFAGDENNRGQARQFINLLKRPARQFGCAFLPIAHPSLTGINSGTGSSGTTGWGNSVRQRLFFATPKARDDSTPDPLLRTLTVNKANYAASGTSVTMKWESGLYVPQAGANSLDKMAQEQKADETFLSLLTTFNAQRLYVSPNTSKSYALLRFASHPNAQGISQKAFEASMHRLLASGSIEIIESGPPSKLRQHIFLGGEK